MGEKGNGGSDFFVQIQHGSKYAPVSACRGSRCAGAPAEGATLAPRECPVDH
jgi:hypothetical protein